MFTTEIERGRKLTVLLRKYSEVQGTVGGTLIVAQLVEALRYKLEVRGFDCRWCHWNFSLT